MAANSKSPQPSGGRSSGPQDLALVERLLDLAHDAIIVRDFDGSITYWNEGATKKYGWTKSEAVGKTTHELLQTVFPGPHGQVARRLLAESYWEGELLHTRRDGKRITVFSRQALDRHNGGTPPLVLEINRDITEIREMEQRLRASEQSLHALSGYLLQSQDEERWRISRELDDATSENLPGVLTRLNILKRSLAKSPDLPAQIWLAECIELAEAAASSVRAISSALYPPALDGQGLAAAVRSYAEGIAAEGNVRIAVESPLELPRLPQDAQRSLYRSVQESITRIRLQLENPVVNIRLAPNPTELVVEVSGRGEKLAAQPLSDSGAAAHPPDTAATVIMERMRQLGGTLEISLANTRILIRAVLPLSGSRNWSGEPAGSA